MECKKQKMHKFWAEFELNCNFEFFRVRSPMIGVKYVYHGCKSNSTSTIGSTSINVVNLERKGFRRIQKKKKKFCRKDKILPKIKKVRFCEIKIPTPWGRSGLHTAFFDLNLRNKAVFWL